MNFSGLCSALQQAVVAHAPPAHGPPAAPPRLPGAPPSPTRRDVLASTISTAFLASSASIASPAAALPLAPLGRTERVGGAKRTNLPPSEVAAILARDLSEGQYFVTGALTPEIFADDCRFKDPTNDVSGLSRYVKALGLLFDPEYSDVRLRTIQVASPNCIEAEWELGGYLRFPWHPRVEPFVGRAVYTLNAQGLIAAQEQTWGAKSAGEALRESFTPTSGPSKDIVDRPR